MGRWMAVIFRQWFEKFGQAWSACLCMMVEGNLSALTVSHAITAAKTGSIAGVGFVIAAQFGGDKNKWLSAWVIGIITMAVDILVHPTHFGPEWMEAACTGLGAALLCVLFDTVWRKKAG